MMHPDLMAIGERVLAAIRDVQRECDYQSAAHSTAPECTLAFFKADALGAFISALNDGMTPGEAVEQAKMQATQCVVRWNAAHRNESDKKHVPSVAFDAIDDAAELIVRAMRELSTVDEPAVGAEHLLPFFPRPGSISLAELAARSAWAVADVERAVLALRESGQVRTIAPGNRYELSEGNPMSAPKSKDKAVPPAWLQLHAQAKAAHPGMIVLVRIGESYLTCGEDASLIAAVLGQSLSRANGVVCAGIPVATWADGLKRIIDAGHRVAVCEPQPEGGVATTRAESEPPPDIERDAIRARYFALPLRHVKGEGTVAKRKGVVKGSIVGPFLVHADKECGWRITHHATGYTMGHPHFAALSEAKLFAWLMSQDGDWDFGAATACGKETMVHVNALATAWRANDWRKIAELCPLSGGA